MSGTTVTYGKEVNKRIYIIDIGYGKFLNYTTDSYMKVGMRVKTGSLICTLDPNKVLIGKTLMLFELKKQYE